MTNHITSGSVKYGETRKTGDFENKRADVELSFKVEEGQDAGHTIAHVAHLAKSKCFEILGDAPAGNLPGLLAEVITPKRAPKMPEQVQPAPEAVVEEPAPAKTDADELEGLLDATPVQITDAELMDATTKCQSSVKNAPAIKKLLNELGVKSPPGRLVELTPDKRQAFLDGLKLIKPLA